MPSGHRPLCCGEFEFEHEPLSRIGQVEREEFLGDPGGKPRLVANLGARDLMMLGNHGMLALGSEC